MEFIYQPWPWYVSGPLITLTMAALIFAGKTFGVSSNLRTMCSIAGAGKYSDFFKINWQNQSWNLLFALGAIIGGFIAHQYLSDGSVVAISAQTKADLQNLGIASDEGYVPTSIFNIENLYSFSGFVVMILGGFLIGFGTRYAGGCTSGHAITGLSNLQIPSLIAVIGFFVGGLITTHLLMPFIFS